jgi:hypothetical protein
VNGLSWTSGAFQSATILDFGPQPEIRIKVRQAQQARVVLRVIGFLKVTMLLVSSGKKENGWLHLNK